MSKTKDPTTQYVPRRRRDQERKVRAAAYDKPLSQAALDSRGLSFDFGRKTGIAWWAEGLPVSVFNKRFDQKDLGEMLHAWRTYAETALDDHMPTWVAYEEARPVNKVHMEQFFGMQAMLCVACYERGIPVFGINTMTMKHRTTGNARATKPEVVKAVKKRFPRLTSTTLELTEDEADAVGVGYTALQIMVFE